MKQLLSTIALAVAVAAPLSASAGSITIDFDRVWNGGNGDIGEYYNGGKASSSQDPATGPKLGISFVNVSGYNNDPLSGGYTGAPSPLGVAYAEGTASNNQAFAGQSFINITSGAVSGFSFYYSSMVDVLGAVRAYSGLNGTGTLLGTLNLLQNDFNGVYDTFSLATLAYGGGARSFDLSALANGDNVALFDNVRVVPEPGALALLAIGGALALVRRKHPKHSAPVGA